MSKLEKGIDKVVILFGFRSDKDSNFVMINVEVLDSVNVKT